MTEICVASTDSIFHVTELFPCLVRSGVLCLAEPGWDRVSARTVGYRPQPHDHVFDRGQNRALGPEGPLAQPPFNDGPSFARRQGAASRHGQ